MSIYIKNRLTDYKEINMLTETERKELMRGEQQAASNKPNYKRIDRDVYKDNIVAVNNSGYTLDSLQKQYGEIPFTSFGDKLKFGASLEDLQNSGIYSGNKGVSSTYVNKRLEILNEVIALLQGAKSPEDLHKIHAFLELSLKAATNPQQAAHYQEIIGAAKQALTSNKEAKSLLKDFDKSFLYDPNSLSKTVNELTKRRDHLQSIKSLGFDAGDSFTKVADNVTEHGIGAAFHASTMYGIGKGIKNAPAKLAHLKNLNNAFNGYNKAKNLYDGGGALSSKAADEVLNNMVKYGDDVTKALQKSPILGRGLKAAKGIGKMMGKALGIFGPWGKAALAAGTVLYAGASLVSSYSDEQSFMNNIGSTISDAYMGDATNIASATAAWLIPGYGSMFDLSYFTGIQEFDNTKQDSLNTLQQGVLA
jgi:hypothetical protein